MEEPAQERNKKNDSESFENRVHSQRIGFSSWKWWNNQKKVDVVSKAFASLGRSQCRTVEVICDYWPIWSRILFFFICTGFDERMLVTYRKITFTSLFESAQQWIHAHRIHFLKVDRFCNTYQAKINIFLLKCRKTFIYDRFFFPALWSNHSLMAQQKSQSKKKRLWFSAWYRVKSDLFISEIENFFIWK